MPRCWCSDFRWDSFYPAYFPEWGRYWRSCILLDVRGSGQGFCYNIGRAVGAACPALIGAWSAHASLAVAIGAVTAASYALVIVAAWALPETRGRLLLATV
jgi:hypothetical protein